MCPVKLPSRRRVVSQPGSAFAGFRFPPGVIVLAVRWYLCCGLSYRDIEELLYERGVEVDHVTVYRWVRRFTPLLADAHAVPGSRRTDPGDMASRRAVANNRVEADRSRLKHRLRPRPELCTDRIATVIIAGWRSWENLRCGHYEVVVDLPAPLRVAAAFTELARAI
jgi:transposase-like protein